MSTENNQPDALGRLPYWHETNRATNSEYQRLMEESIQRAIESRPTAIESLATIRATQEGDNSPALAPPQAAEEAPPADSARFLRLKDVDRTISEWGVYWGLIDQNTVKRVYREGGRWHLLADQGDLTTETIRPPFKIYIGGSLTVSAAAYQTVSDVQVEMNRAVWETGQAVPTLEAAIPIIHDNTYRSILEGGTILT